MRIVIEVEADLPPETGDTIPEVFLGKLIVEQLEPVTNIRRTDHGIMRGEVYVGGFRFPLRMHPDLIE